MLELLRIPVFRRLYASHVIHIMGNEFTFIAVVGLLHDLSGSGLSFAGGTIFRLVPYVLTSIFAGALLERWEKRRVMVWVNFARAILVSLFFWVTAAEFLWVAYLLMALINIFGAFFTPAMQVAVVQTVSEEKRLAANSLLQSTTSFLIIVCQGAAAFLVYYFSYRFNFLLDAACYLVSLVILLGLPGFTGETAKVVERFSERLRAGFNYVREHGGIRRIILLQMAERILGANYIMLMYYVLTERKEGLFVFGLLDIPMGLGGVAAGVAVGKLAERLEEKKIDQLLGLSLILTGICVFVIFHSGPLPMLMVASLFSSFASFSLAILSITRLQKSTESHMLARVFSIREMATAGTFAIGCLLVGYGAEQVGSAQVSVWLAIWGAVAGMGWLFTAGKASEKQSEELR